MREAAFLDSLSSDLTPDSARSYCSYARRAERDLKIDLDTAALDDPAIEALCRRLATQGVVDRSIGNIRSALRRYAIFRKRAQVEPDVNLSGGSSAPLSNPLLDLPVRKLLELHGDILDELRGRGVLRTANGPTGDYAEWLFARAFGWTLSGNSQPGYDAEGNGKRYQIKGRRLATPKSAPQLSPIRNLDADRFDAVAAVLFDTRYQVIRAVIVPRATVIDAARYRQHTNSWTLILTPALCLADGVMDVTMRLKQVSSGEPLDTED